MTFSKKEKTLFYIAVGLLTIFLLHSFVFRPFANKMFSLNQKISLEEANFKKGLILLSRKKDIEQEHKSYQPYLNIKGSDEEITAELLKEIEQLAQKAGLSLANMQPQTQKKKKTKGGKQSLDIREEYKEYGVQLRFESGISEIINFLYNLHSSSFLLRVKKIILNNKDEKSEILKGEMIISGVRIR